MTVYTVKGEGWKKFWAKKYIGFLFFALIFSLVGYAVGIQPQAQELHLESDNIALRQQVADLSTYSFELSQQNRQLIIYGYLQREARRRITRENADLQQQLTARTQTIARLYLERVRVNDYIRRMPCWEPVTTTLLTNRREVMIEYAPTYGPVVVWDKFTFNGFEPYSCPEVPLENRWVYPR